MIASRSLCPWRTSATSLRRTGTPPATAPEPPDALCTEAAAAIAAEEPVAAATRAISAAAASAALSPAARTVTSISPISSTLANWLTVRTR